MIAQEVYKFSRNKYNDEGINIENGSFFLQTIKEWEINFHRLHPICFANYLVANSSTMKLLNICLDLKSDESCGMDLVDGQIDFDTNFKMENHSQIKTIYGIGSAMEQNKNEPLIFVIDDKTTDGTVILKFIPDNDSGESETPKPVECDLIKMR